MNATVRGWRRTAMVLAALLLVAGCSTGGDNAGTAVPPQAAPNLERYYAQELAWGPCVEFATNELDRQTFADPALDCAYLEVPVDYSQPDGATAQIAVLRKKAADPARRVGSLVINPGGPGSSGTSTAANLAGGIVGTEIAKRFDLVGFDPRGVGASKPAIQCLTGPERDAERLDLDLGTSPEAVAQSEQEAKAYVAKCVERTGQNVLANVGTRDVVQDMDILRAALGEEKLTYLGYSYGTRIGYSYAEEFPNNVRALVLDGALDPDQELVEKLVAQSAGFQLAFDNFAANCATLPACPLGSDPKAAVERFRQIVDPLIKQPLPLPDGRMMSYSDAMTGTIQALYSEQLWEFLRMGLTGVTQGNGELLMRLADLYEGRNADGSYEGTIDAFGAIRCVDDQPITDRAVLLEIDRRVREVAPFRDDGLGPHPARDPCAFWPVPPTSEPHVPQVDGLPQVLVISVTGDPATPYQAGIDLAKALDARLLTVEGQQHTVALQGVPCVDQIVASYLVDLTLPPEGARCTVQPQ